MKRYMVFAYDRFYPQGGFNDFVGSFDTEEEVEQCLTTLRSYNNAAYDTVDMVDSWVRCIHRSWVSDDNKQSYVPD